MDKNGISVVLLFEMTKASDSMRLISLAKLSGIGISSSEGAWPLS